MPPLGGGGARQAPDFFPAGPPQPFPLAWFPRSLGMEIGDAELEDMVAEFDLDKDGMINEQEFLVGVALGEFLEFWWV